MRSILILLTFCVVVSCVGPKKIQRKLNKDKYSTLLIKHVSSNFTSFDKTLTLNIIDNSQLREETTVDKEYGDVRNFIVAASWDYTSTITLGRNSFKPELVKLVEKTFIEESIKTGNYSISEVDKSEFNITISIDSCNVNAEYITSGGSSGSANYQNHDLKPSKGVIKLNIKLYGKENLLIFENDYFSNSTSRVSISKYDYNKDIYKKISLLLTKTLSDCLANQMPIIVKDINNSL